MAEEKRLQTEKNEPLDATELDDDSLEDAAGGGDILCNVACDSKDESIST